MSDENIAIKIEDKVDAGIATKIRTIENSARTAHSAVTKLTAALNGIKSNALAAIGQVSSTATQQLNAAAMASQRLATEQARTAAVASAAANRTALAQQQLATATARTGQAQAQAATAGQRLATAQQQTATAASNAAAAQTRAALAALRLQQAQQRAQVASNGLASSLGTLATRASLLIGGGFGAVAAFRAADSYTVLQNKLQNVSETMADNNLLTEKVFELANKTRTPVLELAAAFSRFDAALMQSGASQLESLRITETVTKALKVGGATAGETASSLLQLSQAFNKGRLNGDEFRSLMENMPVFVKKAIAEAANIPLSGIFDAAAQGKISLDVLRKAFTDLGDTVDKKFAKTIPTASEAWTVFKNNMTQSLGEMNKALGITRGVSNMLIFLSTHLREASVAVVALGTALTVYFGSNLLRMFGLATGAVRAFTLALASNPIGLIAIAISATIAYLVMFADKIQIGADKLITLQVVAQTVWAYVKDYAKIAADFVSKVWNGAIDLINKVTNGWGERFRDIVGVMLSVGKRFINSHIAAFVAAYTIIVKTWQNMPAAFEAIGKKIANNNIAVVEFLVNSWQTGLRSIAGAASSIAPEVSERLNSALDAMTIELPRFKGSKEANDFATDVRGIIDDAFSVDYIGNATDAFMKRAAEIARANKAAGKLRGEGKGEPNGGGDGGAAEKRARALAKVNMQLDAELNRLFMLKPEREIQEQFDKIEIDLAQKKIRLSAEEATAIKGKLRALQEAKFVQQQFDRIYEESVGPARDYNAALAAADKLLKMGAISQADYNREILKSSDAFKAATDPFHEYNEELRQERELLQTLPQFREAEQRLQQLQNSLRAKGIELTKEELALKRAELTVQVELNKVAQEENRLQAESNAAKLAAAGIANQAMNNLLKNPAAKFGGGDAAEAIIAAHPELNFEGTQTAIDAHVNQFANMYAQIKALQDAHLISEQTAAALRTKVWVDQQQQQLNTASSFFGSLAALQSSSNTKIARIGKAAAIAQAMINTYQSATAAYAAMAAIPVYGPALGAAAAAAAVVAGIANVAQIRAQPVGGAGYMQGGYTGDIPRDQIAGAVHGREYVMDASATNRIGVSDLEALRSGAASVQRNADAPRSSAGAGGGSGSAAAPSVHVAAPQVHLKQIIVDDPSQVGRHLNTPEGETELVSTLTRLGYSRS